MKIPIRNVYYLLCYAWDRLEDSDLVDVAALGSMDRVQDLLGKVLAEGTFRLLRRGIDQGYREITEEIAGVRGKLEIGAMATRAVRARGRTICTYEEFSPDVLHNRILRSTLATLLRSDALAPTVQRDVTLAHDKLHGITNLRVTRPLFNRVQLDRNQQFYRFLLSVCELIHESSLVDPSSGAVRFRDFRRDRKTMWRVFEDFVLAFFRKEQSRYVVKGQPKVAWHGRAGRSEQDERFIPSMSADVILEAPDRRIILDTKFYREPLRSYRGSEKMRSNNLYQLLAYLENRQAAFPEGPRFEGVLLYPAVEKSFRIDVELQGFRIQARTLDMSREWREVHGEMLALLAPRAP